MDVIWSPSALRQVARIYAYIADVNPRAAGQLARELRAAGDGLARFPDRGRPIANSGLRELVAIFPYIIRYRTMGNTVRILRVRHGMRRQ